MIRKVSAEDIAIRGNGTGLEYMCPTRHFVYIFFNPVFQVSTAKNEINLFNNHILIVAPVTFAPAGAMTPSAEFLSYFIMKLYVVCTYQNCLTKAILMSTFNTQLLYRTSKRFSLSIQCIFFLTWHHDYSQWLVLSMSEVGNILFRRLIVKYFLRSFSPFCWFKKGSCQFLAKECAQYWLTA